MKVCDFVSLMFNFGIISTINKAIDHIHANLVLNSKIQTGIINP